MKKYKNDIILVGIVLFVATLSLILFNVLSKKDNLEALIYVNDELVETIDLSKLGDEVVEFRVDGEDGEVVIEAKYNAIRIVHATCPQSYCKKQGFSSSTHEPIICIPNKIYIKLVSNNGGVDIEL